MQQETKILSFKEDIKELIDASETERLLRSKQDKDSRRKTLKELVVGSLWSNGVQKVGEGTIDKICFAYEAGKNIKLGYPLKKQLKIEEIRRETNRLRFPLIEDGYYIENGIPHYGE